MIGGRMALGSLRILGRIRFSHPGGRCPVTSTGEEVLKTNLRGLEIIADGKNRRLQAPTPGRDPGQRRTQFRHHLPMSRQQKSLPAGFQFHNQGRQPRLRFIQSNFLHQDQTRLVGPKCKRVLQPESGRATFTLGTMNNLRPSSKSAPNAADHVHRASSFLEKERPLPLRWI